MGCGVVVCAGAGLERGVILCQAQNLSLMENQVTWLVVCWDFIISKFQNTCPYFLFWLVFHAISTLTFNFCMALIWKLNSRHQPVCHLMVLVTSWVEGLPHTLCPAYLTTRTMSPNTPPRTPTNTPSKHCHMLTSLSSKLWIIQRHEAHMRVARGLNILSSTGTVFWSRC